MNAKAKKQPVVAIPKDVRRQLDELVKQGWFRSSDEIVRLALRKFVDSHRPEVMEKHILDDVEWGLRGGD